MTEKRQIFDLTQYGIHSYIGGHSIHQIHTIDSKLLLGAHDTRNQIKRTLKEWRRKKTQRITTTRNHQSQKYSDIITHYNHGQRSTCTCSRHEHVQGPALGNKTSPLWLFNRKCKEGYILERWWNGIGIGVAQSPIALTIAWATVRFYGEDIKTWVGFCWCCVVSKKDPHNSVSLSAKALTALSSTCLPGCEETTLRCHWVCYTNIHFSHICGRMSLSSSFDDACIFFGIRTNPHSRPMLVFFPDNSHTKGY